MKVASFEGVVENGRIQLPAGVTLPEGAKVYVICPEIAEFEVEPPPVAHIYSPRLADPSQAADFVKMVVTEEETDAAE